MLSARFLCSAVCEKPDDKVDNLYAEENQGNHADDRRCRHKLDGRFTQAFNNHAGQRAINQLIMHAVCSGCCRIHLLI